MTLDISENIKRLPKKDLKKWVSEREKENRNQDWKDELAKLKKQMENVERAGRKSKKD
jgi:hypothetical protein